MSSCSFLAARFLATIFSNFFPFYFEKRNIEASLWLLMKKIFQFVFYLEDLEQSENLRKLAIEPNREMYHD